MDQSEEHLVLTLKKFAVEWEADENTPPVQWDVCCGREAQRGHPQEMSWRAMNAISRCTGRDRTPPAGVLPVKGSGNPKWLR